MKKESTNAHLIWWMSQIKSIIGDDEKYSGEKSCVNLL